jgi:hypothetical protein
MRKHSSVSTELRNSSPLFNIPLSHSDLLMAAEQRVFLGWTLSRASLQGIL